MKYTIDLIYPDEVKRIEFNYFPSDFIKYPKKESLTSRKETIEILIFKRISFVEDKNWLIYLLQ